MTTSPTAYELQRARNIARNARIMADIGVTIAVDEFSGFFTPKCGPENKGMSFLVEALKTSQKIILSKINVRNHAKRKLARSAEGIIPDQQLNNISEMEKFLNLLLTGSVLDGLKLTYNSHKDEMAFSGAVFGSHVTCECNICSGKVTFSGPDFNNHARSIWNSCGMGDVLISNVLNINELIKKALDCSSSKEAGKEIAKAILLLHDMGTKETCSICDDGGTLILCDSHGCPEAYHPLCLGLKRLPDSDWFCPKCENTSLESSLEKGATESFSSRITAGNNLMDSTSHGSPGYRGRLRSRPEKKTVQPIPRNSQDLLSLGVFEGETLTYRNENDLTTTGVLFSGQVVCNCEYCGGKVIVSVSEFEKHAGGHPHRRADSIFLANGIKLRDLLRVASGSKDYDAALLALKQAAQEPRKVHETALLALKQAAQELSDFEKQSPSNATDSSQNSENSTGKVKKRRVDYRKKAINKLKTSRDLLSCGVLEGLNVTYNNYKNEPLLSGVVKSSLICCMCESCSGKKLVSATEFEIHAGSTAKHPRENIFISNGKSFRDLLNVAANFGTCGSAIAAIAAETLVAKETESSSCSCEGRSSACHSEWSESPVL